ncbi:MAG TPA: glycosyltransferase [Acidimicrobiales bacterium]|nr:glycosyltransferase [Acidimicrobiales bacterium]
MRIGIVAPPWLPVPPPRYGGTEAIVDRLARGFLAAGHEVLLWTTGDSTCPVPKSWALAEAATEHMGFDAIELHHLVRGYRTLVEWGADIVHDHTLIGPVYSCRHPELVVVTTNHGPFDSYLSSLYRSIGEDVPIIAISHDQASRAEGVTLAGVIHHGIDLDSFPVGDGGGDEHGEYFLYLGRMAPEKGARRAALAARQAGARLLIAAKMIEPAEHRFFEEQVQPLLDDRVRYIGEVGGDERLRLLQGATALLNPIAWPEPFGLVMIEALASGTPVLAFPNGSVPEIVDHGITGFHCTDVDDLAARLGDAGALDRAACRDAAERRFSTQRMVTDHLALFERVVADRDRRRVGT